jgi:hypothetical protein
MHMAQPSNNQERFSGKYNHNEALLRRKSDLEIGRIAVE